MMRLLRVLLLIGSLAVVSRAQIPSFGRCPDYVAKQDFDMSKFTGMWYEYERNYQLPETVTRCMRSNYTKTPDGKYHVINEVQDRVFGLKILFEGEIRMTNDNKGKFQVRYSNLIPFAESQFKVLDTDYENYALLWDCNNIALAHAHRYWIMTRKPYPNMANLMKAYAILDLNKIPKNYVQKTNAQECGYTEDSITDIDKPIEASKSVDGVPSDVLADAPASNAASTEVKKSEPVVAAVVPVVKDVESVPQQLESSGASMALDKPVVVEEATIEKSAPAEVGIKSVPEVIMKIAQLPKEGEQAVPSPAVVAESPTEKEAGKLPFVVPEQAEGKKSAEIIEEMVEVVKP